MLRRVLAGALIVVLLSAPSARAVHFGWQSLNEGGIEYIVEVEPDLMDVFRAQGFSSDIPPGLRDVRRIRLIMGEQRLPNQDDINGPATAGAPNDRRAEVGAGAPNDRRADGSDNGVIQGLPAPPKEVVGHDAGSAIADSKVATDSEKKTEPGGMAKLLRFFEPDSARQIKPVETSPPETNSGSRVTGGVGGPTDRAAVPTSGMPERHWPIGTGMQNPRMAENEAPANAGDRLASDGFKTFGTAMMPNSPDAGNGATPVASKPWLLLMAVLLMLFASLGANVYLVWIHQAVRSKYLALVGSVSG